MLVLFLFFLRFRGQRPLAGSRSPLQPRCKAGQKHNVRTSVHITMPPIASELLKKPEAAEADAKENPRVEAEAQEKARMEAEEAEKVRAQAEAHEKARVEAEAQEKARVETKASAGRGNRSLDDFLREVHHSGEL